MHAHACFCLRSLRCRDGSAISVVFCLDVVGIVNFKRSRMF